MVTVKNEYTTSMHKAKYFLLHISMPVCVLMFF